MADANLKIRQQSCLLVVPVAHRLVPLVDRVAVDRVDFASIILNRPGKDELSPEVSDPDIVFAHVSVEEESIAFPDSIIFNCTLQNVVQLILRDGLQVVW